MATQSLIVESALTQAEAFVMLADLTRVPEWDPGVAGSVQTTGDGPALGAQYEVSVSGFDGKPTQAVYEITAFEAGSHFEMVGKHPTFRAHDRITLVPGARDEGSVLTYVAELELLGETRPMTDEQLDRMFIKLVAVIDSGLSAFLNPT